MKAAIVALLTLGASLAAAQEPNGVVEVRYCMS